ncbi:MAG TPA: hypothetical protein VF786_06235, partial [Terriglobales bacterium]
SALLLVALFANAATSRSKRKAAPEPPLSPDQPRQMLVQAYDLTRDADPLHRCMVLQRLIYAPDRVAPGNLRHKWADELYTLAHQIPAEYSDKRALAESSATQVMVKFDMTRALSMLDAMEPGDLSREPDRRAQAAGIVFPQIMNMLGARGIPIIREHARVIGDGGVYPYVAMVVAVARDQEDGSDVYREAIKYASRGTDNLYGVSSFTLFVDLAHPYVGDQLTSQGATVAAAQLRRWVEAHPEEIADDGSRAHLDNRALASRALHTLQRLSPPEYATLSESHPELLRTNVPTRGGSNSATHQASNIDPQDLANADEALTQAAHSRNRQAASNAIEDGVAAIDRRFREGACGDCLSPEGAATIFVRNAAKASPRTIRTQLNGISDPYYRAMLLVTAANAMLEPAERRATVRRHSPLKQKQ